MTSNAESLRKRAAQAIRDQKPETVTVLSCLLAVEDELGYIPPEAAEEVARVTGSTINDVWGVASFYTNFQFQPPGRHRVEVCWGPTCHVKGVMPVIRQVMDTLGIDGEGATRDGNVSLRFNTCLGACANGPVISVDHHLMGRITPDGARHALEEIRNGTPSEDDGAP